MIEFQKYLNQFGWPKRSTPDNKITIKYQKKIFLFSKFVRIFNLPLKFNSFELIERFYHDKFLSNSYHYKGIFIFYNKIKINLNLRLLSFFSYFFFKNKKIYCKKNDIFLFGPYSNSYYHLIFEFLLRLIFLKKKKYKNKSIWLHNIL